MPAETKRKRSLRESSTNKRRECSRGGAVKSVTPKDTSPSISRPESTEPVEEEVVDVPTSFDEKGPLPISSEIQRESSLPAKEWKSIAESAVLRTAFDRSRDVWLSAAMFEKYWTKPTKKKIVDDKNPPKDSMVKIGECTLSVQPHVFEIKMYSVRDKEKERIREQQYQEQQELYQAQLSQTPKYAHPGRPTNSAKAALHTKQHSTSSNPQSPSVSNRATPANQTSPPPTASAVPEGPDPVIQLLATRASSDPELKALMRVVASGQATNEQLRSFQAHIDVLTPLARAAAAARARQTSLASPLPAPASKANAPSTPVPKQASPPIEVTAQNISTPLAPLPSVIAKPQPQVYQKPKHLSVADRKHLDICNVVFEFTISVSGDRFSIPKNSIIEYRSNGCELLLSYLYVCEADLTYQPITLKFNAPNPRYLEPISRIVDTPENAKQYMKDVVAKYKRATNGYLMMRLKRDEKEILAAQEAEVQRAKEEEEAKKRMSLAKMADMYQDILLADVDISKTVVAPVARPKSKKSVSNDNRYLDFGGSSIALPPKTKFKSIRSRKGRIADPSKSCHLCNTNKTSLWRRAEIDGDTVNVCNACGIKWKTNEAKKERGETPLEYGPRPVKSSSIVRKATKIHSALKGGKLIQALTEGPLQQKADIVTLTGTHELTPEV